MKRLSTVLAAGALLAAACGGSSHAATSTSSGGSQHAASGSYNTTNDIRQALVSAGLGCTNYHEIAPESGTIGEASCDIDGSSMPIYVFANATELINQTGTRHCGVVSGNYWAMTIVNGVDPAPIAKALHVSPPSC